MENARHDTRTRILDTAESLFADQGYELASLRTLTLQAQVNLAAVNYHFGSKEELFRAVLLRRMEPLIDECMARLEAIQAQTAAPTAETLVRGLVQPFLDLAETSSAGARFIRLLSRALTDDYPLMQSVSVPRYGELIRGFTAAFLTALPHLTRTQLAWRLSFGLLVLLGAFSSHNDTLRVFLYNDIVPALDAGAAAQEMIPFIVAGLSGQGPTVSREYGQAALA